MKVGRKVFEPPVAVPIASVPPANGACLLLDKIPGELRNEIYELAFLPGDECGPVDLFTAKPPQKDLLMTCRRIHRDTEAIYQDTNRNYWENTEFFFCVEDVRKNKHHILGKLSRHSAANIDNIKHLTIHHKTHSNCDRRLIWHESVFKFEITQIPLGLLGTSYVIWKPHRKNQAKIEIHFTEEDAIRVVSDNGQVPLHLQVKELIRYMHLVNL